jgi:hypothetical protein
MRLLTSATGIFVIAFCFGQGGPDSSKQQILHLEKAYTSAKGALAKHPKSSTAKHTFAVAADMYATAAMTTSSMTPHQRYPLALKLYREVLKVEPSNHEAANNSEMIISVYKSMHRPIPK